MYCMYVCKRSAVFWLWNCSTLAMLMLITIDFALLICMFVLYVAFAHFSSPNSQSNLPFRPVKIWILYVWVKFSWAKMREYIYFVCWIRLTLLVLSLPSAAPSLPCRWQSRRSAQWPEQSQELHFGLDAAAATTTAPTTVATTAAAATTTLATTIARWHWQHGDQSAVRWWG